MDRINNPNVNLNKFRKKRSDYVKKYGQEAVDEISEFDDLLTYCLNNNIKVGTDNDQNFYYIDCNGVADYVKDKIPTVLRVLESKPLTYKLCSYVPLGSCKEYMAYVLGIVTGLIPDNYTIEDARKEGYLVSCKRQDGIPLELSRGNTKGHVSKGHILIDDSACHLLEKFNLDGDVDGCIWLSDKKIYPTWATSEQKELLDVWWTSPDDLNNKL